MRNKIPFSPTSEDVVNFSMTNATVPITKNMKFFIEDKNKNRVFSILNPSPFLQRLIKVEININTSIFGVRNIQDVIINFNTLPN